MESPSYDIVVFHENSPLSYDAIIIVLSGTKIFADISRTFCFDSIHKNMTEKGPWSRVENKRVKI